GAVVGRQGVFHADQLAAVGAHPAQDGRHRRHGAELALIERLASPDAGEQIVVFGLVGIVLLAAVGPQFFVGHLNHGAADVGGTLGALAMLGDTVPAARHVAAPTEHPGTVGV